MERSFKIIKKYDAWGFWTKEYTDYIRMSVNRRPNVRIDETEPDYKKLGILVFKD